MTANTTRPTRRSPPLASISARMSFTSSASTVTARCVLRKIKRLALKSRLEKLPPCIVGMEACLSAHFVSRTLRRLGHTPRIIPAIYVKPS